MILPEKTKEETRKKQEKKNAYSMFATFGGQFLYTANGVPSLRSATRSSTFVNHSPSSFCFSAVVFMCCDRPYEDPDELVELPRLLPSRLGEGGFDGVVVVSGIR